MIAKRIEICKKWHFIEAGLPESECHVEGDGTHFSAVVVCPAFVGKTRLQKQQMVYDTVKDQLLDGSLHALSIKAYTPEEWEALDDTQDEAN
jgi:acid stress-induced BolA-like protein IbaG/YrbA